MRKALFHLSELKRPLACSLNRPSRTSPTPPVKTSQPTKTGPALAEAKIPLIAGEPEGDPDHPA